MSQRNTLIYTALVTGCLVLTAVLLFPDSLFEIPEYGKLSFLKDTNTELSVSDGDLHTRLRVFDQRHKFIITHDKPTFDSMDDMGKYFKNGPEGVTINIKEVNIFNPFFAEGLSDLGIDCGNLKKESDCNSASGCVWCKSGAIPSRCYTQELAKKLPSGVFTCDHKEDIEADEVVVRMKDIHLELTLDSVSSVSASENLREKKKLCDPNVGQAAGYFRLGSQEKHYFFWFFESRNKPSSDPVILWMTGGPGCSSELALFVENGPCTITADGKDTKLNPYSWNNNASIIFIDQPAGTGFSYGTYDTNEEAVGSDMDLFLREFFAKFTKFAGNKFFVFGESYAGHYVPATAHAVWKANQSKKAKINLAGIGIGNGLTDPEIQYQYYADMAYNSTTAPARVSYVTYKLMKAATPACIKAIQKCNEQGGDWSCVAAANFCNAALFEPYGASGYNPYDMRIKCDVPGLCYDFSAISKYLSQDEVLDYLGVDQSKRHWESCDAGAHEALMGDWMKNYQSLIPDLLHDGIPVLVYAGDVDYIVNYLGCRAWPMQLEWRGKRSYVSEVEHEWTVADKPAGKLRSHGKLSFLQVYQAGHMVPMDKPKEALEMVNQFMMHGELHST